MALRYFTLSSSLCAETIGGAWEVRLEKNMERVRAMVSISFYLYEVGSARAPKGFPWWTAGMTIGPREFLYFFGCRSGGVRKSEIGNHPPNRLKPVFPKSTYLPTPNLVHFGVKP